MDNNKIIEKVSKRLEKAMHYADINQIELSKKIGVSHSTISMYLSDQIIPRRNRIADMADALGVNPAWLCGFDTEMTFEEKEKRQKKLDYISSLTDEKLDILIDIAQKLK